MSSKKKLIAGNWKMNGTMQDTKALIADIINGAYESQGALKNAELLVCPTFLHIYAVRHAILTTDLVSLGAQDCALEDNGAHTGDVSAQMLRDAKCAYVILGHSERRQNHGEQNEAVAKKAERAHEQGLTAIICVGETDAQRQSGEEETIVEQQLRGSVPSSATAENTLIAYEPVWAIGTGNTATSEDVKAMHAFIRKHLSAHMPGGDAARILYGGSMKPGNAAELLSTENVDGGLIGGASLKAEDFLAIAKAA